MLNHQDSEYMATTKKATKQSTTRTKSSGSSFIAPPPTLRPDVAAESYRDVLLLTKEALIFNERAMIRLSETASAVKWGFVTLIIAGILPAVLSLNLILTPWYLFQQLVMTLLLFIVFHGVALLFGGKADLKEYFRVFGMISVMNWIVAIPVLGWMLSIPVALYLLVLNFFTLMKVHKLDSTKAAIVGFGLPVLFIVIIVCIGAVIGLTAITAMLMGTQI